MADVITQNWEDGENVIAYTGQKLNASQRKYFACENEFLALLVSNVHRQIQSIS